MICLAVRWIEILMDMKVNVEDLHSFELFDRKAAEGRQLSR